MRQTDHMPTSDPWAWSLETLLALIAVIIAGLGAIATVLIATFALVATNRANRLEASARERAGRVALSSAIDAYLKGWETDPFYGASKMEGIESAKTLAQAAAEVSSSAESVAMWVIDALRALVAQIVDEHGELDNVTGGRMLAIAAAGASSEMRRRITKWVATGLLDRSLLLTPTPGPPPFTQ